MASNIYIQSSGSPVISPTDDAAWEFVSDEFLRVPAVLTPGATTLTELEDQTNEDTADGDMIIFQAILTAPGGGPLPPQNYAAQTVSWTFQMGQDGSNNNQFMALGIRAIAAVGGAVLGTLIPVTRDGTEVVTLGVPTARTHSMTSTAVNTLVNHYLVIEGGSGGDPSVGAHNSLIVIGDSAAGGDLPANDTDATTTKRPVIRFANDILTAAVTGKRNMQLLGAS